MGLSSWTVAGWLPAAAPVEVCCAAAAGWSGVCEPDPTGSADPERPRRGVDERPRRGDDGAYDMLSGSLATIPQGTVRRRSGEESPTQMSKWRSKWRGRCRPGAKEEIARSNEHSCWRGLREQGVSGKKSHEGEKKCSWACCRESRLHTPSKTDFLAAQGTVLGWD